jgi:hypothetical protein
MCEIESNPLQGAMAEGLTLPILARIVGANGTVTKILFEGPREYHVLSFQSPIDYPFQWTLTGSNEQTIQFIQTERGAEELSVRLRERGVN